MLPGRCFIVDPVCAITYGHSLNSLSYFYDLAKNYFEEVHVYASKQLPIVESSQSIIRYFNFYYEDFIDIKRAPLGEGELDPDIFHSMDDLAACDFYDFFHDISVSKSDTILLPSADAHSLNGLTNAIARLPHQRRPRLLIRLINVMENVHWHQKNVLPDCIQRVLAFKDDECDVSLAAETPKYARYLRELSGSEVHTTPYPPFYSEPLPIQNENNLTVLCGGSGRPDKGFFRLAEIIDATNRSRFEINFIVQNLPEKDQFSHIEYINRLYSIPNVTLLPGVLPYNEILNSYRNSHITLMPYDVSTYEYRGSAMLMESLLFGRQCIGQSGTGFSDQIELYGAGMVCASNSEMAYAIHDFASIPYDELIARASTARNAYIDDVGNSYRSWIIG